MILYYIHYLPFVNFAISIPLNNLSSLEKNLPINFSPIRVALRIPISALFQFHHVENITVTDIFFKNVSP